MRWSELDPEPSILEALEYAGPQPRQGTQNEKRHWSEKFANACAVAVAHSLRDSEVSGHEIRPYSLEEGTEPLTPLGSGTRKRIDVTVVNPVLGLEIGVSLKGFNFRDGNSGNFDKNLTGRLYELGDEVRLVHEHLPRAFMVGVLFLPIQSTRDKVQGNSSFANTVMKLRDRTGRLDPALAAHSSKCDAGYVALYTQGGGDDDLPPGIARFVNVTSNPPRRGRPLIANTLSLSQMTAEFVAKATYTAGVEWGEAESD